MNSQKLKCELILKNKTIPTLSMALNISKTALYRKMKGDTEFTREEIQKTINFLNLDENKVMEIFFDAKVS